MISKYEVLKLIEEYKVIGYRELANYFGMSYNWAINKLNSGR